MPQELHRSGRAARSLAILAILACSAIPNCRAQAPVGGLDLVDGCVAKGWAYDPGRGYNPVPVRIEVDGSVVATGLANQRRSDLQNIGEGLEHGFALATTPVSRGWHRVVLIVKTLAGQDVVLASKMLQVDHKTPVGHIESVTVTDQELIVTGWAHDQDAGGSIPVHLYVDGAFVTWTVADQLRPDLLIKLGASTRGFRLVAPRPSADEHEIRVFGINVGSGAHRVLPSRVPTEIDLSEALPPVGTERPAQHTIRWDPSERVFHLAWFHGGEGADYVIDPSDAAHLRGLVTVFELRTGSWPVFRAGCLRRTGDGTLRWPESLLADPSLEVSVDDTFFDGETLEFTYNETYQGATTRKRVAYRLVGRSLRIDVQQDDGVRSAAETYAGFDLGRDVLAPGHSVHLPYMMTPIHVGAGHFTSRYADATRSHGTRTQLLPATVVGHGVGGLRHDAMVHYDVDTAGDVQPLNERIWVTVSSDIEDTFMGSSARPSAHRAEAGQRMIYDTWGVDRSLQNRGPWQVPFAEQGAHFAELKALYGLDDVTVLRHNWGSYRDFAYPKLYPANSEAGGDYGFAVLARQTVLQGWRFAAHENHGTMFGPTPALGSPPWFNHDHIAKMGDGSWHRLGELVFQGQIIPSYAIPADLHTYYADLHSGYVAQTYGTNSGFWDVQLYLAPPLDLDATQPRVRTLRDGILAVREAAEKMRDHQQGPVHGESYARAHDWTLVYAGACDGVERELVGGSNGLVIPDYELRVVQPLMANQGAGYLSRFFDDATRNGLGFPGVEHHDLLRSRTVAYGHVGFVSDTLLASPEELILGLGTARTFSLDQILKEYYLTHELQARMLSARMAAVHYHHEGQFRTLSQVLTRLAALHVNRSAFDAAVTTFFQGPRLRVLYDNGLTVHVHAGSEGTWPISANGGTRYLPPSGWFAHQGGFEAWTAHDSDPSSPILSHVTCADYIFHDDRVGRIVTIWRQGLPTVLPY